MCDIRLFLDQPNASECMHIYEPLSSYIYNTSLGLVVGAAV